MNLSEWQQNIIDFVQDDNAGHGIVSAYAGSGKTFLLERVAEAIDDEESMFFGAFNTPIAAELNKRIRRANTEIRTLHSLGFMTLKRHWGKDVNLDKEGADYLGNLIEQVLPRKIDPDVASDIRKLVEKCMAFVADDNAAAADERITELMYRFQCAPADERTMEPEQYVEWARKVLVRLRERSNTICFGQMIYVPAFNRWSTGHYRRVAIDETQDMNRAQLIVAKSALHQSGRFLAVGDRHQCHPPGVMIHTRHDGGAVPIETLTGEGAIAGWNRNAQKMCGKRTYRIAARPYEGALVHVQVDNSRAVPVTPNHKVLARWTERAYDACVTYLMYRTGFGFRVGWCKLFATARDGNNKKAFHLSHRARIEKADAVWILKVHTDRTEASVYESIVAATYGLPTITFEAVNGANHITETAIRTVFAALTRNNFDRGLDALRDHGRAFDLPLYPWPSCQGEAPATYRRATYFVVHATNLEPDLMRLPLPDEANSWATVTNIARTHYVGDVYSLDVDTDHSYAANGVVVLNSIYAWNGADASSMDKIKKTFRAREMKLPISYRAPEAVAARVRNFIPDFKARDGAPQGLVKVVDSAFMLANWRPGDFYLSRKNAPLPRACLAALKSGVPAYIRGGKDMTKGFYDLIRKSRKTDIAEFVRWIKEYAEKRIAVLMLAKQDRAAEELADTVAALVELSEGCDTTNELRARLDSLFADTDATGKLMVSSVHKAKGLETPEGAAVWLDEASFRSGDEEDRIRYVAETRTRDKLYLVKDNK